MASYKFTSEVKKKSVNAQDSGISWVMAVACLFMTFIVIGINRANGLLFVAYLNYTRSSRQVASWPFNVSGAAVIIVAPIIGVLSTKLSPRAICLTGGILASLGTSACFFSVDLYYVSLFYGLTRGAGLVLTTNMIPAIINQNFKVHRATAFGIATSGTALGTFIFPAVTQYCLEEYELKGTFLLLGGMALHTCIGATVLGLRREDGSLQLINYSPKEVDEKPTCDCAVTADIYGMPSSGVSSARHSRVLPSGVSSENELNKVVDKNANGDQTGNNNNNDVNNFKESTNLTILCDILKSPHFYLLCLTQVCMMNLTGTFTLVIVDYVMDKGVPEKSAFWILTAFSFGEMLGRLALGWITDKRFVTRQMYLAIQMAIGGVSLILLTFAPSFTLQLIAAGVQGVTQGTLMSIATILLTDYLKLEAVTWAVSLMRALNGVLVLARAPIIGYFRDEHGTYDQLFQIISGIFIFISLVWFIDSVVQRMKNAKDKTTQLEIDAT